MLKLASGDTVNSPRRNGRASPGTRPCTGSAPKAAGGSTHAAVDEVPPGAAVDPGRPAQASPASATTMKIQTQRGMRRV